MTDEPTFPTCPVCAETVEIYDHQPGYQLEVPHPLGGKDWVVGTSDEIYADPMSRRAAVLSKPTPNSTFTKVDLKPCGHQLDAGEAMAFLTAAAQFHFAEKRKAALRVLDVNRAVLENAEARGYGELVQRYRDAVHSGSSEVDGLRAALAVLTS